jgi:hypothetical protein
LETKLKFFNIKFSETCFETLLDDYSFSLLSPKSSARNEEAKLEKEKKKEAHLDPFGPSPFPLNRPSHLHLSLSSSLLYGSKSPPPHAL